MSLKNTREPKTIMDVIMDMAEDSAISSLGYNMLIDTVWSRIAGKYIYEHTTLKYTVGGILRIFSSQASVKSEIFLRKEKIIEAINKELGKKIVEKIELN